MSESKKAGSSGRKKAFLILGVTILVGLIGFGAWRFHSSSRASTDDAQVDADIVMLGSKVSGTVLHVSVNDNQAVKAGDLIAEIDPEDYHIRVAQAQADLDAAVIQASHDRVKGEVNTAQIEGAKAALAQARSAEQLAHAELKRAEALQKESAISRVELENAQNTAVRAHAATSQAEAQLRLAQDQSSIAEARVKSAQATLDQANAQLRRTRIVAPRDGLLSKLAVEEGQIIQAGQMIAQLSANEPYVIANFKETQIGTMIPGQKAEIEIDAYPGKEFDGTVESLSPATGARFSLLPPDNASGNFVKVVQRVPVRIHLDKLDSKTVLRAGLSAYVTVHISK